MRKIKELSNFSLVIIKDPGADDFDFIENKYKINKSDLDEFYVPYHSSDYDIRKNYSYLILTVPKIKKLQKEEVELFEIENIYFYFSKTFFIIICDRNSNVDEIAESILESKESLILNTERFSYQIIKKLFSNFYEVLKTITQNVDYWEKNFKNLNLEKLNYQISFLRKNTIIFETVIKSWIDVFTEITEKNLPNFRKYPFLWTSLLDEISYIYNKIDDYLRIIEGISRSIETNLSIKINKNIILVTIIQTVFLPPTLIASIYGMNIKLPIAEKSYAFFVLITFMIIFTILTWRILIKKSE
jgi:magnesium transporter